MMNSYIEITNLSFSYTTNRPPVLDDISISIDMGEQIAIIGQNGIGKTTFAKLIIGMLKPDQGTIKINGESIHKKSIARIAQKIGYVFQNPNTMLFTRSVHKELELSMKKFNYCKEETSSKINEMLEFFELGNFANTHPRFLSRGEKQKLALATVLIQEPQIIILDEPFSGIDHCQRKIILDYIKKFKSQGRSVLIISHDLNSIVEISERIIALFKGKIAYDLPTSDFFKTKDKLNEIGLHETEMLSFIYELHEKGLPNSIFNRTKLIKYFNEKLRIK